MVHEVRNNEFLTLNWESLWLRLLLHLSVHEIVNVPKLRNGFVQRSLNSPLRCYGQLKVKINTDYNRSEWKKLTEFIECKIVKIKSLDVTMCAAEKRLEGVTKGRVWGACKMQCVTMLATWGEGETPYSSLRSRYENATPNLCWVCCALLGVLCN